MMIKKIRKNTQLSLINPRGAGRKAIHDKGIRHTERETIKNNTVLHLTVKINKHKASLKNKSILKALHHSIKKARMIGLKIIQYTLEYDHVHLLVEASDRKSLSRGMQSLGISFSKGINKVKRQKGSVFKTRYHLRKLSSPTEIKNALNYILGNGIKHGGALSILNPYNSASMILSFKNLYPGFEKMIEESIHRSDHLKSLRDLLREILAAPKNHHLKQLLG